MSHSRVPTLNVAITAVLLAVLAQTGTAASEPAETLVRTPVGQPALLHCDVQDLDQNPVAWIRQRDLHILAVGQFTYTNDQRFQVLHRPGSSEWTLKVASPTPEDSGTYVCQLGARTQRLIRLEVTGTAASESAETLVRTPVGQPALLHCDVQDLGQNPVAWIRQRDLHILAVGSVVFTNDQRFQALHRPGSSGSTLKVASPTREDSGTYVCQLGARTQRLIRLEVTGEAAAVFETDKLTPTFPTLKSRQCLPDDFDATTPPAAGCAAKVNGGVLPAECQGASKLALFYNCYSDGRGLLSPDGTTFNFVPEIQKFISRSNDQSWNDAAVKIFSDCQSKINPALTARQQGAYSYMCLRWSLLSNCDQKQKEAGSLDEAGIVRRTRFLSGECPLSPNSLKDLLERVTKYTLAECSQAPAPSDDPHLRYAIEATRIGCLLRDFTSAGDKLDFPNLKASILKELSDSVGDLQFLSEVVIPCSQMAGTAQEFVKCWADKGLFGCVFQEANQGAGQLPSDCAISA